MTPVARRTLGSDGPELSVITLGTMRLLDRIDDQPAWRFLLDLLELGIDTHHSSTEYDTDAVYVAALAEAKRRGGRFRHIAKIAEPSWDDVAFDGRRLRSRVDEERQRLGAERIDVVQWLVRTKTPADDSVTVPIITEQAAEIRGVLDELVADGVVGATVAFPYTERSARASAEVADGLAVYLNPVETELAHLVDETPAVAIRPFAGGAIADHERPDALRFVLSHQRIASTIVSVSSRHHARSIARWANDDHQTSAARQPVSVDSN